MDCIIKIKVYILKKIPIISFKIDKEKLNKLKKSKRFNKLEELVKKRMNELELKYIKKKRAYRSLQVIV